MSMPKPVKELVSVGGTTPVIVLCVGCGTWVNSSSAFADVCGKAFTDYYCHECANRMTSNGEAEIVDRTTI